MEPQHNERLPVELSSQLVSIMTTEHYTLQTGRSMTITEATGRASLFVGAVSSGLVALALVGQLSNLGTAFLVFSLVVLPTLFLSMAGMMAMINSVLAGSFVGLLLAAFSLPLVITTCAGVVAFLLSVGLHQRYQWRQWLRLRRHLPVLFPGQPGE